MKNEKCRWVLSDGIVNFFNGLDDYNSYTASKRNTVDHPEDVDEQYRFLTESDALNFMHEHCILKNWFSPCNMDGNILKPKQDYVNVPFLPKVKKGKCNETCHICGTNILADEPYVLWGNINACLHCIMHKLTPITTLCENVPEELTSEWERFGQKEFKKCMEYI